MSEALSSPPRRKAGRPASRRPAPRPLVEPPPLAPEPPPPRSKWKWIFGLTGTAAVAWFVVSFFTGPDTPASKPAPTLKLVTIQATPPPPTPPPPPPPPKLVPQEPKMIEQEPVQEEEPKPEEAKPVDEPPPDLVTGIKGDGPPDGFGLTNKAGGGGTGRGLSGSGAGRSRWGWYAAKVQTGVSEALRRDPKLREAVLNGKVRIWPDATGRINRAKLDGSTGDAALDAAIIRSLTGVQLAEPPPADMPSPITLRVAARRP